MAFWVRRTQGTPFYIADLGNKGVEAGGGEADLHASFLYEEIQASASLAAAFLSADLVRIDGPGGSVIPSGQEYYDAVAPHALSNLTAHEGLLNRNQLVLPTKWLTVGSQGCDYTSIKTAVAAAISGGASASNPWGIRVYPGTYAEDPMTIQSGIALSAAFANRMDTVFVTANNAAADLFTCTGGYIAGIRASGVTDSSYALFRMATASTLTVMHGVSLRGCSTGIAISNGASVVLTSFSINLTGPSQGVTTGISVSGTNSYLALNAGFFSVPSALLALYGSNPIQTVVKVSGCDAYLVGAAYRVAYKDNTADVILADDGAEVAVMASEFEGCNYPLHIGATGSNTKIVCSACSIEGCYKNVKIDSSTGTIFANFSVDAQSVDITSGGQESGLIQVRDENLTRLLGDLKYQFPTGKDADLKDYFSDFNTTGVCDGGAVTAATGLNVDVAEGDGWIRRGAPPDEDAFWVQWADVTDLALTASSTNYVYYDSSSDAIVAALSAPGAEGILLATVITDGSGIRFLHNTRNVIDGPQDRLHQYLLDTRKRALKSGLGVSAGSSGRKFDIGAGSYYIALNILSYAGASDAGFSYFYGTNGATEVTGQTQVDNTQYDNAGTLTTMTSGYYRSDTVILTSDGRVSVIYGTAEYSTQQLAEEALSGNTPTFLDPTSFPLARLIVQEGGSIVNFIDIRPQPAQGGTGGSGGVTVHSALSGLGADDHTQYLLGSGSRAMTGSLNMGGYNVTNVGTVDGVDVSAHASRHAYGSADALSVGTPGAVVAGASASQGSATTFALSDHGHSVPSGAPSTIGTANSAGTSSSLPHLDHVHDHGSQSTGTHHAVATLLVNGFMSTTQVATLDNLARGDVTTPVYNASGGTLAKGKLVVASSWNGTYNCANVVYADNSDPTLRPAIGILPVAIPDATQGVALLVGTLVGIDTSAWALTDQLVLGTNGDLSRPPPEQDPFPGEIQPVGSVTYVHATDGTMAFNASGGMLPVTGPQRFALEGTNGSPSKTNPYVTDSDPRNTNARTPTSHSTSHKPGGSDSLDWRQLTYFLDEGPGEGFLSGAYKEVTGGLFPSSVIWYDSSGVGKKKIVEQTITWTGVNPTTVVWKVYDAAEVLVKTITDTITYSGVLETSRTRTMV